MPAVDSAYRRLPLSAYADKPAAREGVCPGPSEVGCVIAGTQKGGTTALASYLYGHPEISIPEAKELHFFDSEWLFRRSIVDYDSYHAKFDVDAATRVLCDATPIYMYWDAAPARIWRYNPAMKWIFVLRDPIERAYSHWNMQRSKGREPLGFLEAIETEYDRCRAALPLQHPWWSYTDRGFYAQQLRRILRFFPREQLLVLKSEDLRDNPTGILERVGRFLDVQPFEAVAPRDVYPGRYDGAPGHEARSLLATCFEHDVRDLERMFGLDCTTWLQSGRR